MARILVAPMEVMAETSGPMGRARRLAAELVRRGHDVAFCSAESVNYRPVEGVKNHVAPTPALLGLPPVIGRTLFKMAALLGAQRRVRVDSFEQVLDMVGALDVAWFERDVAVLREAIRAHRAQVVYAEFRLSAIVAAKSEKCPVATAHSVPTTAGFARDPRRSRKLRAHLEGCGFPAAGSILEVFDWADLKIVPSSPELEPMGGERVVFTGPFAEPPPAPAEAPARDQVVVYMGNGSVTPRDQLRVLRTAFADGRFGVCLASGQLEPGVFGPVRVEPRFDFRELLPRAAVLLDHGGQNTVMDGLLAGVPQLVCPGMIFERRYNARSVADLGAGMLLDHGSFQAEEVRRRVDALVADGSCAERARSAGRRLVALGGVSRAAQAIEDLAGEFPAGA